MEEDHRFERHAAQLEAKRKEAEEHAKREEEASAEEGKEDEGAEEAKEGGEESTPADEPEVSSHFQDSSLMGVG